MGDGFVDLSPEEIAQYAYEAEVLEFSEPGGMMDHYSTAMGGIIFLDSFPSIKVKRLNARLGKLVLGNSGEPKDTMLILARVKNQMQQVVKKLQKSHPGFMLQSLPERSAADYSNELTEEQVELLRGTLRNRDITMQALTVLDATVLDHKLIGDLMNDHQAVLRDVLKISTPKIDRMISASLDAGAYGAKINGSGGGGCMFAYSPNDPEKVKKAIEKEGGEAFILTVAEGSCSNLEKAI